MTAQNGHAHSGMSSCIAVPTKPAMYTVHPKMNSNIAAFRVRQNALNEYRHVAIAKPEMRRIMLAVSIRILVQRVVH
jgi:hypothetical protein